VPAFCCALHDLESPLGTEVAAALESLLAEFPPSLPQVQIDPDAPDLDDPKTDLRALVGYLSAPARCGLFLSSAVLERIGRTVGVPRGFGPRARVLRELILGSARYERMHEVLGAIADVARTHQERLARPPWVGGRGGAAVAGWRDRLTRTIQLLEQMDARAAAERATDRPTAR
jgi:hypothetical protein